MWWIHQIFVNGFTSLHFKHMWGSTWWRDSWGPSWINGEEQAYLRCDGYCRVSGWGPLGACFSLLTLRMSCSDFDIGICWVRWNMLLSGQQAGCALGKVFCLISPNFAEESMSPFPNHRKWYEDIVASLHGDWGDNKIWQKQRSLSFGRNKI